MTGILNARVLASVAMLVFVGAAIAASTGAFFSDTESSTGNTFTAGDVTIGITNLAHEYLGGGIVPDVPTFSPNGFTFALGDLKPLDKGTITYGLENGSNDAYFCAAVVETGNADNVRNDPESVAGDSTDVEGELGQFLSFSFGSATGTLAAVSGQWFDVGTISGDGVASSSISYCFGVYNGSGQCVLDNGAPYNQAQTDSLTAAVHFYAVQTRNNPTFKCSDLASIGGDNGEDTVINQDDLATSLVGVSENPLSWFFYNDKPSEEGIMTINQFAGSAGANEIVAGPGSEGAAYMKLHNDVDARYNIATYQFSSTTLSSIGSLKYRVYDESPSSQTPFLNFNVSFDGADTWQKRLVQVPAGVTPDTWTEVDALAGMWSWSGYAANGNKWPDNNTNEFRTWNDIKAAFPNASIRKTDSFFGVRVGHPGPIGEESYVDWIEFDGVKYDFEN